MFFLNTGLEYACSLLRSPRLRWWGQWCGFSLAWRGSRSWHWICRMNPTLPFPCSVQTPLVHLFLRLRLRKKLKLKLNQRLKFYVFPVISQQQEYDDMKYIRYVSTRNLTIILYLTRIPSFICVLTLIYMCTYSCGNTRSCFEWWSLYFRLARSTPCGILATEGNIVNKCSYHE